MSDKNSTYVGYGMEDLSVTPDELECMVKEGLVDVDRDNEFTGTYEAWRMVWIFKATGQTLKYLRKYPKGE